MRTKLQRISVPIDILTMRSSGKIYYKPDVATIATVLFTYNSSDTIVFHAIMVKYNGMPLLQLYNMLLTIL